jgi:hypothetical protein
MLDKKFTRQDVETLIEAMGDWEMVGNHEYHVLTMIKNAPMPPENHEAFEAMAQIKDYFQNREKDILASRSVRQEKAIFLKAKLLMLRQDVDAGQFIEMAINSTPAATPETAPVNQTLAQEKLEQAEYFIKDLGVWDHFQKFLTERKTSC